MTTMNEDTLSPQVRVWQIIASIPKGSVATYGQVAELAGLGRGARYVGSILKKLPSDTKLPWHRVVNAQGKVSFPVESDAYKCQTERLADEGISLFKGRIDMKSVQWKP